MKAWITKEYSDEAGKRKRQQVQHGTTGVKPADRFVVEWIDPSGTRKREKIAGVGRPAKKLADDRCQQLNSQLTLGTYEDSSRENWAQVKARYIRDVLPTKQSSATCYEIRRTLDKFETLIAPNRMTAITTATIDRFVSERLKEIGRGDKPVKSSTVNKDLRFLKGFFRKAAKWKAMTEIPEINMLDEIEEFKPTYTDAEIVAMYQAADAATLPKIGLGTCSTGQWWRTLIVVLYETGMRIGETISLDWSGVDLLRHRLTVNPASQRVKAKRIRQFTFGEQSEQHLRLLAEHGNGEGPVFPWNHEWGRLNDSLEQIQEKAGIDTTRRNLKFHAFRRTVGETTAELYGLTAAQHKLGHTNAAVTAKHYARAAMRSLASKSSMPVLAGLSGEAPVR